MVPCPPNPRSNPLNPALGSPPPTLFQTNPKEALSPFLASFSQNLNVVMGKLCEGGAILDGFQPVSPVKLSWLQENEHFSSETVDLSDLKANNDWESVSGLQEEQRRVLHTLSSRGVHWKHSSKPIAVLFLLFHGGDVRADGHCLFTAANKAMQLKISSSELRRRVVNRFSDDYANGVYPNREIDDTIRNLYHPDLEFGWGVHFVQEVKLLAFKKDRESLDSSIDDLVQVGLSRELAAETVYKEKCISVSDGNSWAKYMSVMGNSEDECDIISLHYTQEGLLTVDENRAGKAAAFGDDIAIEALANEFQREIFVVQAHGSDAATDEGCLFFLPHQPRGQISDTPIFLLMRGTGWCGAGADHYEPLIAYASPVTSQEKAVVVL